MYLLHPSLCAIFSFSSGSLLHFLDLPQGDVLALDLLFSSQGLSMESSRKEITFDRNNLNNRQICRIAVMGDASVLIMGMDVSIENEDTNMYMINIRLLGKQQLVKIEVAEVSEGPLVLVISCKVCKDSSIVSCECEKSELTSSFFHIPNPHVYVIMYSIYTKAKKTLVEALEDVVVLPQSLFSLWYKYNYGLILSCNRMHAFADSAFKGNPAVWLLEEVKDEEGNHISHLLIFIFKSSPTG
ncbi:uncharacterized protein [Euphorbia lathyris]|uniref:uncharacterized protein n=1 Tax=Euphorbia lathyris TaxID=212925 RepID=UPI0033139803